MTPDRAEQYADDAPARLAESRRVDAGFRAALEAQLQACPDCEGSGRVAVHVCRDERECARRCLRVQACVACGGAGRLATV